MITPTSEDIKNLEQLGILANSGLIDDNFIGFELIEISNAQRMINFGHYISPELYQPTIPQPIECKRIICSLICDPATPDNEKEDAVYFIIDNGQIQTNIDMFDGEQNYIEPVNGVYPSFPLGHFGKVEIVGKKNIEKLFFQSKTGVNPGTLTHRLSIWYFQI